MNKTDLAKYYPIIYKGVLETDQLVATENKLFEEVEQLTLEVEQNQFILTANARGLAVYENMLNIIANPQSDSIQFRRERIINRLSTALPYTLRYLKQRLNSLLGVDNYDLELIYDDYVFHLVTYIGEIGKLDELLRTLFAIVPVNLQQTIENKIIEEGSAKLFIGQALETSMIYNLTSDIGGDWNIEGVDFINQVADVATIYNLSSDISTGITLNANAKAAQVVSPGMVYNIE